ncbi:GNAT family N-acetyltransferase [Bosea sp. BIWAKO-01]|uniref:GNAT family N-acetyltransferase n=1 Tax=Bosea sp. BIWAKO-01 TaxID=506668 RepID=UPI0008539C7C|nr:GNAT family N-acetyltransferase [Bosea sp. BIWAKO-01]GAU81371.1 acetyltransferase [Bosea sp. BIWAKO-01]
MAEITIRLAVPRDAVRLPEIERSAGQIFRAVPELAWIADDAVMSAEAHRASIVAGTSWVALDVAGDVVGFLSAERIDAELHVWELAVRAEHQGRGIGTHLVGAATGHARASGLRALTLTTFRTLAWNERFYTRLGFVTLEGGAVEGRLGAVLEREGILGLPIERRCAMRLDLIASS